MLTVLNIENDTEITELISMVLRSPLINLVSSITASEGLKKAHELRPDLAIIDIMLPDMDGWSVYDVMRRDEILYETPVIILTALEREEQPRRSFHHSPIDAYMTKPFDTTALRTQVEHMLKRRIW